MKAQKVRDLDDQELRHQLREMDEQLFRLQFQMSMGQMDGLKKVRAMRKDRARILTILRERELAGAGGDEEVEYGRDRSQGIKNEKIGQVVSTKMAKTIVVEVSRRVPHPLYKRIIKKRKKFYAHDEAGHGQAGRRGADRGVPAVEQAEALDASGSGPARGAGGRAAGGSGCEGLGRELVAIGCGRLRSH